MVLLSFDCQTSAEMAQRCTWKKPKPKHKRTHTAHTHTHLFITLLFRTEIRHFAQMRNEIMLITEFGGGSDEKV